MTYKDIYFTKNTYLAFKLSTFVYKDGAKNNGLNIIEDKLDIVINKIKRSKNGKYCQPVYWFTN